VPTAAAIANAIYNASGIRVRELPIPHEFILNDLKKKKTKEEADTPDYN
jgi:CO/xanthine dehydrogenase Mo-binding subunit